MDSPYDPLLRVAPTQNHFQSVHCLKMFINTERDASEMGKSLQLRVFGDIKNLGGTFSEFSQFRIFEFSSDFPTPSFQICLATPKLEKLEKVS